MNCTSAQCTSTLFLDNKKRLPEVLQANKINQNCFVSNPIGVCLKDKDKSENSMLTITIHNQAFSIR